MASDFALATGDGDLVARDFVPTTDAVSPMSRDSTPMTNAYGLMPMTPLVISANGLVFWDSALAVWCQEMPNRQLLPGIWWLKLLHWQSVSKVWWPNCIATSVEGPITENIVLTTGVGGPVTRDTAPKVIVGSLVTKATSDCRSGTNGFKMCLFGGEIRWIENFGEKMGRKKNFWVCLVR